jgi:ACS family glucarate transporter-like MFS transporter
MLQRRRGVMFVLMATRATTQPLTGETPTHARYWVVVFAVTLAILSYIDRVLMSQAMPGPNGIAAELHVEPWQKGYIFGAFGIAYAIFEMPGGWLGDLLGPRKVLMRVVIWWSCFTALTGTAFSLYSLVAIQFLFGAGEAGCFPNLTKAFSSWLQNHERVRMQSIMWMSARWAGAITPLLAVQVLKFVSWRIAFPMFGCLGVVWAVLFYRWFRDRPRDHPSVNAAELALLAPNENLGGGHGNVPWRKLASSKTVWLLWAQYFCLSYPWYFYITYLPTFLRDRFPYMSDDQRASLAFVPLFFGGLGSLVCGFITPRVVLMMGSVTNARRRLAIIGFLGAAVMLTTAIQMRDPLALIAFLGLTSFCNDLVMPGAWATCMDVGGKYAGTLSGSMNMMGNLGGFVAPVVGGYILSATGGKWEAFLYTMAAMYVLGSLCWPFIDTTKQLEEDPVAHP